MKTRSLTKLIGVLTLVLVGIVSCPVVLADEAAVAEAPSAKPAVEYFPLVPKVNWDELNWLQKTTASIAIVPGCILSSLANCYLWCRNF